MFTPQTMKAHGTIPNGRSLLSPGNRCWAPAMKNRLPWTTSSLESWQAVERWLACHELYDEDGRLILFFLASKPQL
jgi:hypothetical protein